MEEIRDDFDDKDNPMKVVMICSQFRQYDKNTLDFQWPWTITMKGSTPSSKRWVVLLILKLWPYKDSRPFDCHFSLHQSMNQDFHMGRKDPEKDSKANR